MIVLRIAAAQHFGGSSLAGTIIISNSATPIVGISRFDDWAADTTKDADGGIEINKLLVSPSYPDRWPYYVNATGPSMDEAVQSVMDNDIQLMHSAGIKFMTFQPFSTVNRYGLDNYLASPYKSLMKFALMQFKLLSTNVTMGLNSIADPQYLTYNGRPVFFFLMWFMKSFSSPSELSSYRTQLTTAGGVNPYFVGLDLDPASTIADLATWDLDAVSLYAGGASELPTGSNAYSTLAANEESEWTTFKNSGNQLVPSVTLGYDDRHNGGTTYTTTSTPSELSAHLQNAITFVKNNPAACPSELILMSSWNEFTENHFLAPTYVSGNPAGDISRLSAVAAVLGGGITLGDGVTLLKTDLTDTPSTGPTTNINGPDLQTTYDAAVPGNVITVNTGTNYVGLMSLVPKTGGNAGEWITIKSAGSLPAEHNRLTEDGAVTYNLPKIKLGLSTQGMSIAGAGQIKVRFIGFEILPDDSLTSLNTLIGIGTDFETDNSQLPANIIFDRCYIHGTDTCEIVHGVKCNGIAMAVIDSTLINFHALGVDAQAIYGWNGIGPLKIHNCKLEATTECVAFGGADPRNLGNNISNVEITNNWVTKRMSWKGQDQYLFKNMIELKSGINFLMEGNVIENSWPQAQVGSAFVIWSNDQQGTNFTNNTNNIIIRNNWVRNCSGFIRLSPNGEHPSVPGFKYRISNNLCTGLNSANVFGDTNWGMLISENSSDMDQVEFLHNTMFLNGAISAFEILSPFHVTNSKFNYNLMGGGAYPLYLSPPSWSTIAVNTEFKGNVLGFTTPSSDPATDAVAYGMPPGNHYISDPSQLGLVGGAAAISDPNATPDQMALSSGSQFKGLADGGSDIGCDIPTLKSHITGVSPYL